MAEVETRAVFFDIGGTLVQDAQNWVPGAKDMLRVMSRAKFRLGLISNTGGLDRVALASHLPGDFDFHDFETELILLSGKVDIEKPDIRIFLQAIRQAAAPPSSCVFVGENLEETFAAQAAGMRAVRIARTPEDLARLISLF